VAIDPRKLKPTELVRLLNSTPLGEVISERQLHRHRARAGYRIGDGKHVDLLRYTAWLVWLRNNPERGPAARRLRGDEGSRSRPQRRAVGHRPRHRRHPRRGRSAAQGAGGRGFSVLLRDLLPGRRSACRGPTIT
jgi:hypothetical protein